MKRNVTHVILLVAVLVSAWFVAAPTTQAQSNSDADLKAVIEALRAEVAALRTEVTALRSELTALKGDPKNLRPDDPTLALIDQELKIALREISALKSSMKGQQEKPTKQADTTIYPIEIGDSPYLGPKDAKVTIVQFMDFQCPYCIREYPKIKQVMKEYPNDVRVVFKHFPLSFHKKAKPVHAASELAAQVSNEAFWKFHDLVMAKPKDLEVSTLRDYARQVGVDLATFDETMKDQAKIEALAMQDRAEATKCKVRGTPTVLINGLKLSPRSLDAYKDRVKEILKKG
jgi:protein-disulfide isomerase